MPDEDLNNHPVVRRLMEEIASLKVGLARAEAKQAEYRSPFQRLFLARRTGEKQWKEQTIVQGQIVEFVDGRQCTDDADYAAIVPAEDAVALLEVEDVEGHRYVPIGGGDLPTGQYQYMVYQMVAQDVAGWDFVRGHPTL